MNRGAHIYKCDFQVHSPRDRNWNGATYVTEEERRDFANRFVKECRNKNLNAVAITDHHDVVFYKYIKEAALDEKDDSGNSIPEQNRLIVFPGIELSIANPSAQLLLIFDPELSYEFYNRVPSKLGISPSPDTDSKTCETVQLNISVETIIQRLNESSDYINKYIILPNVKPGGYKTFLRHGNHTIFSNLPCVGGYIEGILYKDLGVGNINILEGKIEDWSKRGYGVFQTSDARSDSFESLGKFPTWVKWSTPSAEALRQACLSRENRILHSEPQLTNIYVSRITINTSKFLGDLNVELNPQYNALIGGRGTGKSTFLEYLRWALCDPAYDEVGDEKTKTLEKKRATIITETLENLGGNVIVEWVIGGVRHAVIRNAATKNVELTIGDHAPRQSNVKEIQSLIAIQSYSQKELSTVGVDVRELRRFVETPISTSLKALHTSLESQFIKFRTNFNKYIEKTKIQDLLSSEKAALASLKEQMASIRAQLEGLPEESLATIDNNPIFENEAVVINTLKKRISEINNQSEALVSYISESKETISIIDNSPNREIMNVIRQLVNKSFTELHSSIEQAISKLSIDGEVHSELENLFMQWNNNHVTHKSNYEIAIEQNLNYQKQLTALKEKEKEINSKEDRIDYLTKELEVKSQGNEDLGTILGKIIELYKEQRSLYLEQCQQLSDLSDGLISATLKDSGDINELQSIITATIQGSSIQGEKIRKLLELLNNDDPFTSWISIAIEIFSIWFSHERFKNNFEMPKIPYLTKAGLIDSELRRLASRMDQEKVLSLLLYKFLEKPEFKYCISEHEQINFENASAGQQASALLKILLSNEGPPLIIDQPEDDLDNEIVASISSDIWKAKNKRQIIFASHNANLVVNGDAELVLQFGYKASDDQSSGEIKNIGSIDDFEIKEAIKSIMEGGERAFKLRLEKYGF